MAIVNSVAYDGTQIEVTIENIGTLTGIESINYGMSKEVSKQKGTGNKFRSRGPGVLNADDASMDIWLADFNNWVEKAGGHEEMMTSVFDVTITYRDPDQALITRKLVDCTPIAVSNAHSTGSETLVVSMTFSVMDVE